MEWLLAITYIGGIVASLIHRWVGIWHILGLNIYTDYIVQRDDEGLKAEIQRVKEEEEQMMREALGLAPKRASRPKGNRIDKHEFSELMKRGSTAEDLGAGHAEAATVHGLGFARGFSYLEGLKCIARGTDHATPT